MGLFGNSVKAEKFEQVARNLNDAEMRYLEVLRRELANVIITINPDLMLAAYRRAQGYEQEILEASPTRFAADYKAMTEKFPHFHDMDLLGTRHVVPYAEAASSHEEDDLREHYMALSKMLIYMRGQNDRSRKYPLFSDKEYEILERVCTEHKGSDIKRKIAAAMERYYAFQQGAENSTSANPSSAYEDAMAHVQRLPHGYTPENEFGIYLKDTKACAVYSYFVSDEGKVYHSYYLSDVLFKERKPLRTGKDV